VKASAILRSEADTVAAGRRLAAATAQARPESLIVYLKGDLGAGKTTFVRGFLRELGHAGRVPSPTYTLIEPYRWPEGRIYHIDLYRLNNSLEVSELALDELAEPGTVVLIEWPERGAGQIPGADLEVRLEMIPGGRAIEWVPHSGRGEAVLRERVDDVGTNM
jgi:tRNA threonylcarbamoyladenosine biosynthesis protein TsaE